MRISDSSPVKRSAATPMTVKACSFMRTLRPTTDGSPPKWLCQYSYERTRTGVCASDGREHPPGGRWHAKQRKAVLGQRFDDDAIDAAPGIQPRAERLVGEQPREDVGQLLIVLQIGKRQPMRHLDVLIERRNRDELLRVVDGQRAEEKRIDDGEDGGAGADADRQRQDRRRGERRRAPQRAERVADVLPQHRGVLARRGGQQILQRLEPEAGRRATRALGAGLLALRLEHLLHLARRARS